MAINPVLEYIELNRRRSLGELFELLRIPSISAMPERREDVRGCASWLAREMERIGLDRVQVLETPGNPVVFGEWTRAQGQPTALVYGHYDVQPVDPLHEWESPPFEPVVRDGRIFARGSADDKGQIFMHLKAVQAYLETLGRLPLNLKFIFEGEEEIGSAHLDAFLREHRDLLTADVVVVSDTPMFAEGLPSICYGLRGLAYCQVEVQSASSDLHSGSYGGAVPNPLEVLSRLLAGLKDGHGRVTVAGFYDRVRELTAEERQAFARLPHEDERFKTELGLRALEGEEGYSTLERLWARPTLELNGVWGGFTGEGAKTVIPAHAWAKISCRLVPDQDPDQVLDLLQQHFEAACPPTVGLTFTRMHGGKASITPIDHPAVQAAYVALERGFGTQPVFIRGGGSIPVVASFQDFLGLPVVLMGVAPHNDHSHAPNERFDVDNFVGGMRSAAHLWQELAASLAGKT